MKADLSKEEQSERILNGIGVAPGIAIGALFVIDASGIQVPEYRLKGEAIEQEVQRFSACVAKTQKQLGQLRRKAEALPDGAAEEMVLLLEAYRSMVAASRLVRGVEAMIREEGLNAEAAVQRQTNLLARSFETMEDSYLASRARDVREVGQRLIRNLLDQMVHPFAGAPEGSLLVAEEITPADTALMQPGQVAGFAAVLGGPEGHTAIMARALGIPAVLGVAELLGGVRTGDLAIFDGEKGRIILRPSPETLALYRRELARHVRTAKRLESLRGLPSVTADGTPVVLEANLELPRDVLGALEVGADGLGLMRTEFQFMNRTALPDEDEQYEVLRDVVEKMDGRPVTVRTLDIGGEKLIPFLGGAVAESANPSLGLRGIRLGLREPKLLDPQLAAILRAAAHGPVRILVPMVTNVRQMRLVRERLFQIERRLRRRGVKLASSLPPLGAMIEIPAAALTSDALTKVSDFFSIGSNDLTQYTLAIDRGDDRVADLFDAMHPSVLRLIQFTVAAAWRANIPVSLCGEMAGNPQATALLLGLGLRRLSVSPKRLPLVKERLGQLRMPQAVALAEAALTKPDEVGVRALLAEAEAEA